MSDMGREIEDEIIGRVVHSVATLAKRMAEQEIMTYGPQGITDAKDDLFNALHNFMTMCNNEGFQCPECGYLQDPPDTVFHKDGCSLDGVHA